MARCSSPTTTTARSIGSATDGSRGDRGLEAGAAGPRPVRGSWIGLAALAAIVALAVVAAGTSVEERLTACLACHGTGGRSETADTPSLGGQPSFFVVAQLFLFREGRRNSPLMNGLARDLTNDDLKAFAERIS